MRLDLIKLIIFKNNKIKIKKNKNQKMSMQKVYAS